MVVLRFFAKLLIPTLLLAGACRTDNDNWRQDAQRADLLHESMQGVTDVIVYDIFSPPQASRIYAYASVAGYEAAVGGGQQLAVAHGPAQRLCTSDSARPGRGLLLRFGCLCGAP